MASAIVIAFILCQILPSLSQQQPIVQVEQGQILGKTILFENEYLEIQEYIDVFLGIPYAEPPIGDRRFAAPLPKTPWSDNEVYNATYNRDICVQTDAEAELFTQSEDCLHLNIYAPNPRPTDAPVMVFIHGGSYNTGNGYQGFYGGNVLAAVGDVILVTINYRLSTFGFLTTGDESFPGNFGLLDQVEALRWINANINEFGGDANRITIFGESSGGVSVSAHLFSPLSESLFQQAILQSGSALDEWSLHEDLDAQREVAFQIGASVGCESTTTQELLSCMRQVDAQVLNEAAYQFGFYAAHAVDNNFLVEEPRISVEKDNFKKCPIVIGFNKDEGTLFTRYSFPDAYNSDEAPFVSRERFDSELEYLLPYYGLLSNKLIENGIQQEYIDWSKTDQPDANFLDEWNRIQTDFYFSCAALFEARSHAMAEEYDVYLYYFTYTPSVSIYTSYMDPEVQPRWLEATHGEELHFMFGYPFDPPPHLAFHQYTAEESAFSYQLVRYWTNFAKTGNPNTESSTSTPYDDDRAWPAFTIPDLYYKDLALNLTTGRGLKADECNFWLNYLGELTTFTADREEVENQWREDVNTWNEDRTEWRDAFNEYKRNEL